jgi:NAD(P)-dependent dehydrogenase (short-subunit alcohol dehydrogenase family)
MCYSCLRATFAIEIGLAKRAVSCPLIDEIPPARQPAPLSPVKPAASCHLSPDTTAPHSSSLTAGGFHCRSAGSSAASRTRVSCRDITYICGDSIAYTAVSHKGRSRRRRGRDSRRGGPVTTNIRRPTSPGREHAAATEYDDVVARWTSTMVMPLPNSASRRSPDMRLPSASSPAAGSSRRSSRGCPRRVRGAAGWGAYSACKRAVQSWTRSIPVERAADGIRVNCIAPVIAAPMFESVRARMSPGELAARDAQLKAAIPLHGWPGDAHQGPCRYQPSHPPRSAGS